MNSLGVGILYVADEWEYPMRLQWREGMPTPSDTASARLAPLPGPTARPSGASAETQAAREPPPKLLIVGPKINLAGEITACDRLVVEGSVQVTLNRTRAIEITRTGRFTNGKAEVDEAEIGGVYEGSLTVRGRLLIRATGRVAGTVRYGELEIERGGRISGAIERRADNQPNLAPQAAPTAAQGTGFIPLPPAAAKLSA
jgi:cytoskeletal protein CcmA (bactofilin family)